jgi:hypothetical protein
LGFGGSTLLQKKKRVFFLSVEETFYQVEIDTASLLLQDIEFENTPKISCVMEIIEFCTKNRIYVNSTQLVPLKKQFEKIQNQVCVLLLEIFQMMNS